MISISIFYHQTLEVEKMRVSKRRNLVSQSILPKETSKKSVPCNSRSLPRKVWSSQRKVYIDFSRYTLYTANEHTTWADFCKQRVTTSWKYCNTR